MKNLLLLESFKASRGYVGVAKMLIIVQINEIVYSISRKRNEYTRLSYIQCFKQYYTKNYQTI